MQVRGRSAGVGSSSRDRTTARDRCLATFRCDSDALGGLPGEELIAALTADGAPVSDGYEMPLDRRPACFRIDIDRFLLPGTNCPEYRSPHLPGAAELRRTTVSQSRDVLLAEEDATRSAGTAIREVRTNVETPLGRSSGTAGAGLDGRSSPGSAPERGTITVLSPAQTGLHAV